MKKFFLVFLLLINCNSAQSRRIAQGNLAAYPWQFVTPMHHGRYGHDVVYAINDKIYVMGGLVFKVAKGFKKDNKFNSWLIAKYNDGRYSNLAYDLQTDQWEYMTSVPGRFSDFLTFYYPDEDKWIYKQGTMRYLSEEEKFKLCQPIEKGKKPTKIYETNLKRQGNGVAIAKLSNDSILWTGGQSFISDVEDFVLPYFIQIDNWPRASEKKMDGGSWLKTLYETIVPPMQEARRDHQAVSTSDGRIFVLGGFHEEKAINKWRDIYKTGKNIVSKTMECYDPKTNNWEYKKPLSRERMAFAAVTGKDDKIYVFGGAAGMSDDRNTPILDTVEVYDPKTDSWSLQNPMPTPRFDHSAVLAADGRMYVVGGAEAFDNISAKVFIYNPEKDTWEQGPDMILPRAALAVAATPNGKIYAIGGTDVGAYKNSAQWKHLTSLIPEDELRGYEGKVQDSVEVLDIFKWKKSRGGEKKKSD